MKKTLLLSALALMAGGMITSCSSDPEYDDTETIEVSDSSFTYTDGVWSQNDNKSYRNLEIDDYIFSHTVDDTYGMAIVYGFTPSKIADASEHNPLYSFPYAAAAGGGVGSATSPYLVGYWAADMETADMPGDPIPFDNRTCRIYNEDGDQFQPQSVMVCCNTYLKYAVLNGSAYNKKFGAGDYVKLIAHGVHMDGTEATATFDLVNVTDSDVEKCIQSSWKEFNLTQLGTCTGIYFTMDSSDKGAYGLNVPTYFCIDKLIVKE